MTFYFSVCEPGENKNKFRRKLGLILFVMLILTTRGSSAPLLILNEMKSIHGTECHVSSGEKCVSYLVLHCNTVYYQPSHQWVSTVNTESRPQMKKVHISDST